MFTYLVKRLFGKTLRCRDVSEFLTDYVEGALDPAVKTQFEEHLRYCKKCSALMSQYRKTVELTRDAAEVQPPPELAEHTLQFLRQRLGDNP